MQDPALRKPLNEMLELTGVSARVIAGATSTTGTAPQSTPAQTAQGRSPNAPVSGTGGQPQR